MQAIVDRSGTSAAALVEQMFDTQNPKPGLASPSAPHCDDFRDAGQPSFNGLLRRSFGPIGGSLEFPRGIDTFQHVSENFIENGEDGRRYSISPAMRNVFIPHRMDILERFLASGTPPVHSN